MKFAGYYVDFSHQIIEEKNQEDVSDELQNIATIDTILQIDPQRMTPDVLELIKKNPLFVATEHVRQGVTHDELSISASKKTEYCAILKGIFIRSTKKQLHVLGLIHINGEKLYIVMYNNSKIYPFQLRQDAVHGRFGKPIMLPDSINQTQIQMCITLSMIVHDILFFL